MVQGGVLRSSWGLGGGLSCILGRLSIGGGGHLWAYIPPQTCATARAAPFRRPMRCFLPLLLLCLTIERASALRNEDVAVVSLYSSRDKPDARAFACQWHNHEAYCRRHGYRCFFVVDSHHSTAGDHDSPWVRQYRHANRVRYAAHWFKVFVLLHALPRFAAVAYMDADALFADTSRPLSAILDRAPGRWWHMAVGLGMNSHTLVVRSTAASRAFVAALWGLRERCPHCAGEQCAVHVLLHQLLLDWAVRRNISAVAIGTVQPPGAAARLSCCSPVDHCKYPAGPGTRPNPLHSTHVQGCTWAWQRALGEEAVAQSHAHFAWHPRPPGTNHILNTIHPVKTLAQCRGRWNFSKEAQAAYQPRVLTTREFFAYLDTRQPVPSPEPPPAAPWPFHVTAKTGRPLEPTGKRQCVIVRRVPLRPRNPRPAPPTAGT